MTCPVEDTDPAGWKDVVPHDEQVFVEGVSLFKDFAVVAEQQNVRPELRVIDLTTGLAHRIEFPEAGLFRRGGSQPGIRHACAAARVLVARHAVVGVRVRHGHRRAEAAQADGSARRIRDGQYQTERTWATAPDGTKVPISLVYKKTTPRDGTAACLLYGYGAYGANSEAYFDSTLSACSTAA